MQEVRSRVFCSNPGCKECLEYWATLDITSVDTSDTFQRSERPEIVISSPDLAETGWTISGRWTRSYYCPGCTALLVAEEKQKKRKAKS